LSSLGAEFGGGDIVVSLPPTVIVGGIGEMLGAAERSRSVAQGCRPLTQCRSAGSFDFRFPAQAGHSG